MSFFNLEPIYSQYNTEEPFTVGTYNSYNVNFCSSIDNSISNNSLTQNKNQEIFCDKSESKIRKKSESYLNKVNTGKYSYLQEQLCNTNFINPKNEKSRVIQTPFGEATINFITNSVYTRNVTAGAGTYKNIINNLKKYFSTARMQRTILKIFYLYTKLKPINNIDELTKETLKNGLKLNLDNLEFPLLAKLCAIMTICDPCYGNQTTGGAESRTYLKKIINDTKDQEEIKPFDLILKEPFAELGYYKQMQNFFEEKPDYENIQFQSGKFKKYLEEIEQNISGVFSDKCDEDKSLNDYCSDSKEGNQKAENSASNSNSPYNLSQNNFDDSFPKIKMEEKETNLNIYKNEPFLSDISCIETPPTKINQKQNQDSNISLISGITNSTLDSLIEKVEKTPKPSKTIHKSDEKKPKKTNNNKKNQTISLIINNLDSPNNNYADPYIRNSIYIEIEDGNISYQAHDLSKTLCNKIIGIFKIKSLEEYEAFLKKYKIKIIAPSYIETTGSTREYNLRTRKKTIFEPWVMINKN